MHGREAGHDAVEQQGDAKVVSETGDPREDGMEETPVCASSRSQPAADDSGRAGQLRANLVPVPDLKPAGSD